MNFPPPQWIRDAATEALNTTAANHYSHPKGRPRLRQAIADHYGPMFNRKLDIENEIQVSSGANEGMPSLIFACSNLVRKHALIDLFTFTYLIRPILCLHRLS
jgi:kynurenine aminotransferase